MITNISETVRNISARISVVDFELAKAYIQGAVHSYCNDNNNQTEISVRILFGGNNGDWAGTPLQCIYDYHLYVAKSKDAFASAANDVGWLFKRVLKEDEHRKFEFVRKETGSVYRFVGMV